MVQRRLVEHFVAETTARCAASLVAVNVKTGCYYITFVCVSNHLF